MLSGVYEIVNTVNDKRYVGSALKLSARWNGHRCRLAGSKHHNKHLQAAWIKYGRPAFEFRVLLYCDRQSLLMYEQIAIDAFKPEYNVLRVAGSSLGVKLSAETKAKISAKALGRTWSEEARAKLSATTAGRKLPPERTAHLIGNKHALGMRHTAERKAQISIESTGRKCPKDAAYREKIAAALRGRKATPEHRANQSAAQLGKKRGPYKKRSDLPA